MPIKNKTLILFIQTLALYKSFTYLLTYHLFREISSRKKCTGGGSRRVYLGVFFPRGYLDGGSFRCERWAGINLTEERLTSWALTNDRCRVWKWLSARYPLICPVSFVSNCIMTNSRIIDCSSLAVWTAHFPLLNRVSCRFSRCYFVTDSVQWFFEKQKSEFYEIWLGCSVYVPNVTVNFWEVKVKVQGQNRCTKNR